MSKTSRTKLSVFLAAGIAAVILAAALSVFYGSTKIPFETVLQALRAPDMTDQQQIIIHELRIPRTIGCILVGAAFAVAGAIMQGVTRNPLADSGLLGINAGASFALAVCLAFLPSLSFSGVVLFSFLGAAVAMVVVYGLMSIKHRKLDPVRLVLAGSAVSVFLSSLSQHMKDEAQQFSLQGEGISVGYQQNIIIPKMDVQIPKGKITSIIGPNGCGKSTLLKALSRMMPVQSGAVLLDGQAIATLPTVEVARKMAILPQSPQAPGGLTVEELVSYGRYPHQKGFGKLNEEDHRAIAWALEITHMAEFAQRGIDALSGGQRQRAWIAMALAQDTPLILLDEPTTYLDMAHQLEVLELLKELNTNAHKTIALVIHDLNLAARFSDWMIAMRKGEVLYRGTPKEIMTNQVLRDVFSLDAYIAQDPWTGRPICMTYRLCRK